VASVLVLVPFLLVDPDELAGGRLGVGPLIASLVVPASAGALVAVAGTALVARGRVRHELAMWWRWRDVGTGVVLGFGGLVLIVPAAAIWANWVGAERANSALGEAFAGRQLGPLAAAVVFLVVWLVAPLAEEIVFRGVLWRAMEHWRWNRWVIFGVTSVVFSVAHLELLRTPLLLVVSIPVGLARLLTGNLLASVVAHQMNNLLPALALLTTTA
jgi:membrane protease YdiL (CAAX protease family)